MIQLVLYIFTCLTVHIYGYPSGAPSKGCSAEMKPLHQQTQPQSTAPPYNLIVTPVNNGGNYTYKVEIKARSGNFEGFMIKARYFDIKDNTYIGTFDTPPSGTKYGECGTKTQTVTHTNKNAKESIKLTWMPHSDNCNKEIEFQATVLQEYTTYWTFLISDKQTVGCQTQQTTPSSQTIVSSTGKPSSTTPSKANNMMASGWTFYLPMLIVSTVLLLVG